MEAPLKIFQPYKLGAYLLKNRIMMSAMSRGRSDPETCVPKADIYSQYFSERAESAGIVVTGSCWINSRGIAYHSSHGLFNKSQTEAWKQVTDAVHKKQGVIFAQLDHAGRSCPQELLKGLKPIAPSPIANRDTKTAQGPVVYEEPIEMTEQDIEDVIKDYVNAVKNAIEAGFDGIELHAAGGFLIDQFLRDHTNRRTDRWGGSVENRSRFLLTVVDEIIKVLQADKIGVKISPTGRLNDIYDSDPTTLYSYVLKKLDERGIAYVHIEEGETHLETKHKEDGSQVENNAKVLRPCFKNTLITNRGLTLEEAEKRIQEGQADMASFGGKFISNPDLVERFKNNWPLSNIDWTHFLGNGEAGFSDYKTYNAAD